MNPLHTALACIEICLMVFLGVLFFWVLGLFIHKLKVLQQWSGNQGTLAQHLEKCAHKHTQMIPEALEKILSVELTQERRRIEGSVAWIGTIGANAPFVGLAGTVLGILAAFQAMATQNEAGSAALMASISRSLVATAAGLFVAIPAVIFYNVLRQKIRRGLEEGQEKSALLVADRLQKGAAAWQAQENKRLEMQQEALLRSRDGDF